MIFHTTDSTFKQDVLQSGLPVLVDFWAEWCGPCKMIAPILEEIAIEYEGRLKVVKLNVDQNPHTAARFAVRGIPTLMIFKSGLVEAQKVGAVSKALLRSFIESKLL